MFNLLLLIVSIYIVQCLCEIYVIGTYQTCENAKATPSKYLI